MEKYPFNYEEAFSRNIGWITEWEQQIIRGKKIAIAGVGGVGGFHTLSLARLGIGAFHLADLDTYEVANFNRQVGATVNTLGQSKVEVIAEMARDINPELQIKSFPNGINANNLDEFLAGVDLFIDGIDFFVLDVRAQLFARCAQRGIPALTAAPLGMGTAYLVFMPGGMTFEEYFRFNGLSLARQQVNFLLGLSPRGWHSSYLFDPFRVDLARHRGPSTVIGCELCAAVASTEALKILLGRGTVRTVPRYQLFDAYKGQWVRGWLPGGNRNPWQKLKLWFGYRAYAKLSQLTPSIVPLHTESEMSQILNWARWAPSGDNSQPWRFEIKDEDHVIVHARDEKSIYDYNGQPSLLSFGILLETMRIAASRFERSLNWEYCYVEGNNHQLEIRLPKTSGMTTDPLFPFISLRSVVRTPYRATPLTPDQKQILAASLGEDLELRWFETLNERWCITRLNAMGTDIRLSIRETYQLHHNILDWENVFSPDRIPIKAIGIDPINTWIMRWAMANESRLQFINRFLGGTVVPRLEFDILPGLFCAAHFILTWKKKPTVENEAISLLRAGQKLQRFWLTATQQGLVMQPSVAPLSFAYYGRNNEPFTDNQTMRCKARQLASKLEEMGYGNEVVFMGRIGWPKSRRIDARSVRRPLADLLLS